MNVLRRACALLLALVMLGGLAACAELALNPGTAESAATPAPLGARTDLVTASDEAPADKSARIRVELAGAYYSQGQYTTALDEVKRALNANPNNVGAYNLRGLIYAAMDQPALADDSFRRALQLAPNDGDTRHNYGWYLCGARLYPEAIAQFGAALALPQYRDAAKTWQAQGLCEARSGDLVAAERSLQRSLMLDPGNPSTVFNLAELALRRGDLERARFYAGRVNAQSAQVTAESLWLAIRVEHKRGDKAGLEALGEQLRARFPSSRQSAAYERGNFDE